MRGRTGVLAVAGSEQAGRGPPPRTRLRARARRPQSKSPLPAVLPTPGGRGDLCDLIRNLKECDPALFQSGAPKRAAPRRWPQPLPSRAPPGPASPCAPAPRADAVWAHAAPVPAPLPAPLAGPLPPGRPGPAERCLPAGAAPPARVPAMEVLRRSSGFAAEIMDAFDRSPTEKELVAQAKALGREFVHARLLRAGLAWNAPERAAPAPGGRLAEVCAVLLRLGECGPRGRARSPGRPSERGCGRLRAARPRPGLSLPGGRGGRRGSREPPGTPGRPTQADAPPRPRDPRGSARTAHGPPPGWPAQPRFQTFWP